MKPPSLRLAALLALLASALLGAAPASAQSGWRLCNQTSFVLEAAVARQDGDAVAVEGWKRLRPGECRVALPAPLKRGLYFAFARSSAAHRGGQRTWPGDVPLCVDPRVSFAVQGSGACEAMGLEERLFRAVRIDKPQGATMTFRETEPFNKPGQSAQAAGLQRLLDDAGVESETVDGYMARRTRAAIAGFLAERNLPANTADIDLVDLLEDIARNRSLEVGMMLCNRTEHRIQAAIGRRRPDGWESRGWWIMDAGDCLRTVDESLIASPHYVYAEIETPQGRRVLKDANAKFCIARPKFAILGREDCERRRYREVDFVETTPPEDGKLVYEFFERSFDAPRRPAG